MPVPPTRVPLFLVYYFTYLCIFFGAIRIHHTHPLGNASIRQCFHSATLLFGNASHFYSGQTYFYETRNSRK